MCGIPFWLKKVVGTDNLTIIKYDVLKPLPTDISDFQYFLHTAGIALPIFYCAHLIETMDANIINLRNLLEHSCQQCDYDKLV